MLKSTMSFTCYLQMVGYIIKHVYPDGRLVYHVINMISSDGGLHQKTHCTQTSDGSMAYHLIIHDFYPVYLTGHRCTLPFDAPLRITVCVDNGPYRPAESIAIKWAYGIKYEIYLL